MFRKNIWFQMLYLTKLIIIYPTLRKSSDLWNQEGKKKIQVYISTFAYEFFFLLYV